MAHDTAGKQGARLEAVVVDFLVGYKDLWKHVGKKDQKSIRLCSDYNAALEQCKRLANNEPFFITHVSLLPSIYGVPWFLDFLIWHPEKFPNGMVAEVKQQSVAGSVDEKYPFVVMSLIEISRMIDGPTVLFVSGGAARQCATDWCLKQEYEQHDTRFNFIRDEAELRFFLNNGRKKQQSNSRNLKNEIPPWLK